MNTIVTIWLLVSFASASNGPTPPTVVDKFYNKGQCERVSKFLNDNKQGGYLIAPTTACIDVNYQK